MPPNANHLVLLAGLGSDTSTVPIDPEHLGYDPRSVTVFSYAGRIDHLGDPDDPRRDQRPHDAADTWAGVEVAASRLAQQLRAHQEREPGRAVDLVGYSMGGVVVAHYLAHHHDAYDRTLPPIGHVITIAAPLKGSDLAALGSDVAAHRLFGPALERLHDHLARSEGPVGRHVGPLPHDAPAIADLRAGSPLLDTLADGWQEAVRQSSAGPLAMGTRVLTIAGGSDAVVGADRARLPVGLDDDLAEHHGTFGDGAVIDHRVLPGGHRQMLESEALREVMWRFLAGDDVVDSPGHGATGLARAAGHATRQAGRWFAPRAAWDR